MGKFINLVGNKYGDWEVLSYAGKSKWLCRCSCNKEVVVYGGSLKAGTSTNCGCKKIKHGCEGTKIYRLWSYMKERCYSDKHKSYNHYGGRGIKVCDEWLDSKNFIDWAIQNGYKEGLTLDRIDVNKDYSPENCRFITNKEQQRNKRNSRYLEIEGQVKTVSEWAEICGLDRHTILFRLNKGETGANVLRKGYKGGGWDSEYIKEYFNL